VIALDKPLSVGKNHFRVQITRPGARSKREVELDVPVDFRVRGDFGTLTQDKPKLAVAVEAVPETSVVIDGRPIPLAADGRARYELDVTADLSGSARIVEPLERKLPYAIGAPGSAPQRGEITLKIGIVPLWIDAPGERIVVETPNFVLAGGTQRGGSLTVAGRPITVDASGRFAQLMNVSSIGETSIVLRAAAPDHAPRLFPILIRRVQSLREEAKLFSAKATTSYAAIASGIEAKRGWAVAFQGVINELRLEPYVSVIVLEVESGCGDPPCFARVVHGARLELARGERIGAYGRISGALDGPRSGYKIPEVTADFVVSRP
jgi:hypothetical protein